MQISSGEQAQQIIKNIVLKLQNIDLRAYEETSYHTITSNLLPGLEKIFDEWNLLLSNLSSYYETFVNESCDITQTNDTDKEIDFTCPLNRLINTIAIAKWEYDWKRKSLFIEEINQKAPLDLLLLIARIYRSILKTSLAIEQALCNYEKLDFDSLFVRVSKQQLEISLEIRRVYTRFIKTVAEENWTNDLELNERIIREKLRRIGSAIAVINGRSIFSQMRVADRILIKQIQQRILSWLSNNNSDIRIGKTIWQDVCSFAELLVEINNRAELIQHDYKTLSFVYTELSSFPDFIKPLPDNLFTQIKTTFGRNDYLDELIQKHKEISIKQWRKAIADIINMLANDSIQT